MNPKNPQAASEGLQRALTGALDRLDAYFPAGHTRKHDVAEVRMLVERITPAIAPGGVQPWPKFVQDEVLECLRNMGIQLRATGQPSARIERAINMLAGMPPRPAAGHAGANIAAAWHKARNAWIKFSRNSTQAAGDAAAIEALTAALAPATATPEHTFPGDTCKACHPELAAPADPPAAGDAYTLAMIEEAWGDAVPLPRQRFDVFRKRLALLAAQEAARG